MIRFSPEVEEALAGGLATVALETSVVAQGLPFPANLETAKSCEQAVREGGAVPAAIGVIEGEVWVGLSADQMRRLAEDPDRMKIGSRDLAPAMVRRANGGTTVSATCELAASAGIRVFATGGIGGVHRGSSVHFDVSQDLFAISKSPVAVVCAGAKSILDLPNTLEALESLGILVVGVGTDEFPSFYSRRSGLKLEHRVDGVEAAAEMMQARFDRLRQGGIVFALPVPERDALPADEMEAQINAAVALADRNAIRGQGLTPFLLAEIARQTGGKSLAANRALLIHTARFAGELATADARLRSVKN
jgi:pseudouridine-5'-phosphate glycosidase